MRTYLDEILSGFQIHDTLSEIPYHLSSVDKKSMQEELMNESSLSTNEKKSIQRNLNDLLGLQLNVDGDFGNINSNSNSRLAISIFQELSGLQVTKRMDETTRIKLANTLRVNAQIGEINRFFSFNHFDLNKHEIKKEYIGILCGFKTKLSQLLRQNKVDTIFVSGHTDKSGSEKSNQKLSQLRAEEMTRHLQTAWVCDRAMTVSFERLFIRSFGLGAKHPIPAAPNSLNRRVEFVLLKLRE